MLKKIKESFWLGFVFAFSFVGFIQDWLGMDQYLEYVANHWVNIHWAFWIFLIACCIYRKNRIIKISKMVDGFKVIR